MKKLAMVLLLAGLGTRLFAIGLGAEWGLRFYDDLVTGPALLVYSGNGLNLAVDWNIRRNWTDIGATLDKSFRLFKFCNIGRVGELNFNVGAGGFINFSFPHRKKDSITNVIGGLRFPIGVSMEFRPFSVYLDVAPAVSLEFSPSFGFGSYYGSAVRAGVVIWL
ncbi:MAG: hypothetical protein LBG76_00625 [Treponema sp.]|jgi:hypothetical protein|nr:hypothetical protein [Treponema sp.]